MNFLHHLDQVQAMLKDFSPVLWSYYGNLKKQGFTDKQAFELTKDFQTSILKGRE